MKVNFMQFLDFWLGVPLCLLFSFVYKVKGFLFPDSGQPGAPKKILFIELSEMGSAIIANSAISRAKSEFGAEVYFLVFKRNYEGVALLGHFPEKNVISVKDTDLFSFGIDLLKALWTIRKLKIDTVLDLELFSRCTMLISVLTGAKVRVGFDNGLSEGLYRGSLLTHPVLYNHHQHMALNILALVLALKDPGKDVPLLKRNVGDLILPPPKLNISESESRSIREVISRVNPDLIKQARFVVLNPDPGLLALRGWPIEKFKELAGKIASEFKDAVIITVGLKRSREISARVLEGLPKDRRVDLCGETATLRDLMALLSISSVLVTNDSGPAHMASLSNVKSVALYGPETPNLYGPLGDNSKTIFARLSCSPCYAASNHRRSCCKNNICLQIIEVEEVFRAVSGALAA